MTHLGKVQPDTMTQDQGLGMPNIEGCEWNIYPKSTIGKKYQMAQCPSKESVSTMSKYFTMSNVTKLSKMRTEIMHILFHKRELLLTL